MKRDDRPSEENIRDYHAGLEYERNQKAQEADYARKRDYFMQQHEDEFKKMFGEVGRTSDLKNAKVKPERVEDHHYPIIADHGLEIGCELGVSLEFLKFGSSSYNNLLKDSEVKIFLNSVYHNWLVEITMISEKASARAMLPIEVAIRMRRIFLARQELEQLIVENHFKEGTK